MKVGEFAALMIDDLITNKRGERYRITQKQGDGSVPQVYRAESIDGTRRTAVRITAGNCSYWMVSKEK